MERKKLELEINQPKVLELLFDSPFEGSSRYGDYFLYAVKNGNGGEFSFFAPQEVHEKMKEMKKGDKVEVTKIAEQKGKKLVHNYLVKKLEKEPKSESTYYNTMVSCFEDAIKIQERFNGMANVNQIAITMFIQRTKEAGYDRH